MRKYKIPCFLLIIMLLLTLTACGSSTDSSTGQSQNAASSVEDADSSMAVSDKFDSESEYLLVSQLSESADTSVAYTGKSSTYVYEMGEDGSVILSSSKYASFYDGDYANSLSRYKYDESGKIVSESIYDTGRLSSYGIYEYNGDELVKVSFYDYLSNQDDYVMYDVQYNEYGEVSEIRWYDSDGEITEQTEYEYTIDEYDENDNPITLTCYVDGEAASYITRTYMTSEEYFDSEQDEGCESYEELAEEIAEMLVSLDAEGLLNLCHSEYLDAEIELANCSYDDYCEGMYVELQEKIENLSEDIDMSECDYTVEISSAEWLTDEEAAEEIEDGIGEYPRKEIEKMGRLSLEIIFTSGNVDTASMTVSYYVARIDGGWFLLGDGSRSSDDASTDVAPIE